MARIQNQRQCYWLNTTPMNEIFWEQINQLTKSMMQGILWNVILHLIKKFHVFWNSQFYYRVHKIPPLDPILSHVNRVNNFVFSLFKITYNTISKCRSSKRSLSFRFFNQNSYKFPTIFICSLCLFHLSFFI